MAMALLPEPLSPTTAIRSPGHDRKTGIINRPDRPAIGRKFGAKVTHIQQRLDNFTLMYHSRLASHGAV